MSDLIAILDSRLDLTPVRFFCLGAVVFAAAILRGFAGFGFGALLLSAGSLIINPVQLVPVSLALEVIATVPMLGNIWRQIHWRAIVWVTCASLLVMPFAQKLLVAMPVDASRAVVSVLIILLVILMWRGARIPTRLSTVAFIGSGMTSGVINGVAAIGGIVVTLLMLGLGHGAAVVRATTAMYLMIADIGAISVGYLAETGLFTPLVWWRVAALTPALVLGVWLGSRRFAGTSEQSWRRVALVLPVVLSVAGLIRLGWRYIG